MSKKPKSSKSSKNTSSRGKRKTSGPSQHGFSGMNIPMTDWVVRHPFGGVVYDSDRYYHRIANRVLKILIDEGFVPSYSLEDVKTVALSLAAYFEDVVSELCIFRTFLKEYQDTQNRFFPWYEIKEEYLYDEVNLVDVQFVMWLNLFARREGSIPNPENLAILNASSKVYNLFVDEFEKAPVNEGLVKDVYDEEVNVNPGKLKTLLMWIASSCYLSAAVYPVRVKRKRNLDELNDLFSSLSKNPLNPDTAQYLEESYLAFAETCWPLAQYPIYWYGMMCIEKGVSKGVDKVFTVQSTPVYAFAVTKDLGDSFMVCSCRGQEYRVAKNSFSKEEVPPVQVGDVFITMLFRFGDLWHICGLSYNLQIHNLETAFQKLEETNNQLVDNMGRKVDFAGRVDKKLTDNYLYGTPYDHLKCTIAFINNSWNKLFYFKNLTEAQKWINKSLIGKRRRIKKEENILDDDVPVVAFITEDDCVVISNSVELIHDPSNPYYNPNKEASLVSPILDSDQLPDSMCKYIIEKGYFDHFSLSSLYGPERGRKLMQDNLRFFMTLVRQYPF